MIKKFESNIEPNFEPMFTTEIHKGCLHLKLNETYMSQFLSNVDEFFNFLTKDINRAIEANENIKNCLNEVEAKMVC